MLKEMDTKGLTDEDHHVNPHDQQIIQYLLPLKEGVANLGAGYIVKTGLELMKESLMIACTIVGPILLLTANFSFIGREGSVSLQAGFGLANSFIVVFFNSLNIYNLDKFGIALSVHFGRRDFKEVKRVLNQGAFTICLLFSCVTLPFLYFSRTILILFGISEANATTTQFILRLVILPLMVEAASSVLRTFCMSQGFEKDFNIFGIINTILCICLSYFLVVSMRLGIYGFVYAKCIYEINNCLVGLYVLKKVNPDTFGMVSISDLQLGLKSYLIDTLKYSLGSYSEILGVESISILVASLQVDEQTTAYMAMISLLGSVYTFGMALSIIARTRINLLIGCGLLNTAKNAFWFIHKVGCFMGLLESVILVSFCSQIANFYSSNNQAVRSYLSGLIYLYSLWTVSEVSISTTFVGIKTIGKVTTLLKVNLITLLIINPVLGLLIVRLNGDCLALFFTLLSMIGIGHLCCYYVTMKEDWTKLFAADIHDEKPHFIEMVPISSGMHSRRASGI